MAITISGSGIVEANIADGAVSSDKLATGIDVTKLADGTVTSAELQYINSLASNAQTQISAAGVNIYRNRFTIATDTATGTLGVITTACTFTPKVIITINTGEGAAKTNGILIWATGSTGAQGIHQTSAVATDVYHNIDGACNMHGRTGAGRQVLTMTSFNSDGFTMANTLHGTESDTQYINYICIG